VKLCKFDSRLPIEPPLQDTLNKLIAFISDAFAHPQIPLPDMDRELPALPTLFQNLLARCEISSGSSSQRLYGSELEELLEKLPLDFQFNLDEFNVSLRLSPEDTRRLTLQVNDCDANRFGLGLSVSGYLGNHLRKMILHHSSVTLSYLEELEEGEELLSEYLTRVIPNQWQAFSATMMSMWDFLTYLSRSKSPEQQFSSIVSISASICFMRDCWKSLIFNHLECEINEIILNLFQKQRKTIGHLLISSDKNSHSDKTPDVILQL
jgi:hypothetical protein